MYVIEKVHSYDESEVVAICSSHAKMLEVLNHKILEEPSTFHFCVSFMVPNSIVTQIYDLGFANRHMDKNVVMKVGGPEQMGGLLTPPYQTLAYDILSGDPQAMDAAQDILTAKR